MKLIKVFFAAVIYLSFIPSSLQAQSVDDQAQQQSVSKKLSKKRSIKEKNGSLSNGSTPIEKPQSSYSPQASQFKIDFNQATVAVLTKSIRGIGLKRAEAIINYRTKNGQFKSFEELAQVKGLGQKFMKAHLKEFEKRFTLG